MFSTNGQRASINGMNVPLWFQLFEQECCGAHGRPFLMIHHTEIRVGGGVPLKLFNSDCVQNLAILAMMYISNNPCRFPIPNYSNF
jgi:hypothetical protein